MKTIACLAVALTFTAVAALAQTAPAANPLAAVEKRQEHMKAMGAAMKTIGTFLKGEGGTMEDVKKAAATVDERSHADILALFPAGTGVGVGESAAKPEIWQQPAEFKEAAMKVPPATEALNKAAQTGEKAQIAPAFQATGKACTVCHDTFRVKKQ